MPTLQETTPADVPTRKLTGWYVSAFNGRTAYRMLGPFPTHGEALAKVDTVRREAPSVDPAAWFYTYGTARAVGGHLPPGSLNARLGVYPDLDTMKEPA